MITAAEAIRLTEQSINNRKIEEAEDAINKAIIKAATAGDRNVNLHAEIRGLSVAEEKLIYRKLDDAGYRGENWIRNW